MPLTVTHRDRDRSIGELTAADFRVFEDGVEQEVTLLDHARRPVSLTIILDTSLSMTADRRAIAHAAIDATLAGLAPEDEASVVIFAGFVGLGLPWTPAQRVPPLAWEQWKPAECTRLFDAIEVALGLIDRSRNPRPVLLLVSDGGENSSDLKFEEIVRTRRQSETLTYAYRPGSLDTGRRGFDEVMLSGHAA